MPELDEATPELDVPAELVLPPPDPDEDGAPDASGKSPMVTKLPLQPAVVEATMPTAAITDVESETRVRVMTGSSLDTG